MCGDVHSHTRSCWRNAGGSAGNALDLHSDLRCADCPQGNGERLGLYSDFLRLLECDLIMMLLERERPDLILLVLMLFYLGK